MCVPTELGPALGSVSDAPLSPQREHRAESRSMSLGVFRPHLMMSGASAIGARCRQRWFLQFTQTQHACWRI